MKSAYELAMERLEKQAPTAKLSDAQRAEIAEIESRTRAAIAERELALGDLVAKANASGDAEEAAKLSAQLAREVQALRAEAESRKERVRTPAAR